MPELTDEGVAEQTAGLPANEPGPAMATEQAEPGKGDEVFGTALTDSAPPDEKGNHGSVDVAVGAAAVDTLAMGIAKVRGLRMTALASLIAIIGPKAKELLELIAGFDPAHLQHLLVRLTQYGEIKTPHTEPAGLEERVIVAGQVFEAWSRMTPGTRDDDYSNWLNRILADNALRDEFVALVGSKLGGPPVKTFEKTTAAALAAGIEGTEVINFGETIAGIILALADPAQAVSFK